MAGVFTEVFSSGSWGEVSRQCRIVDLATRRFLMNYTGEGLPTIREELVRRGAMR